VGEGLAIKKRQHTTQMFYILRRTAKKNLVGGGEVDGEKKKCEAESISARGEKKEGNRLLMNLSSVNFY